LLVCKLIFIRSFHRAAKTKTYCNPINIDYGYTPIQILQPKENTAPTADPVITMYKGDYYLFSTNQWGYWWSHDMYHWNFIPRHFLRPEHKVYDDLCAPAVWVRGDTLMVFWLNLFGKFPDLMSTNPKANEWKKLSMSLNPAAGTLIF